MENILEKKGNKVEKKMKIKNWHCLCNVVAD